MFRKLGSAIHRGFFWTYERGTWQYDIMVALILAFVFLTPRHWFHDQPTVSTATSDVVLLRNDSAGKVYRLRASLLDRKDNGTVIRSARRILRTFTGKPVEITRIEPVEKDSEGEVISYAVWIRE
ncbi:MAG: hypothetical protein HY313_07480 [Acidobacteria bacterium]|nr:hypothetical protein [Acidobacteriota bacterium]